MKSLSDQILDRKRKKTREAARENVRASGGIDVMFRYFENRPTAEQYEEMVLAAKFGPKDPLSAADDRFTIEYILDELNAAIRAGRDRRDQGNMIRMSDDGWAIRIVTSQSEHWGNLMFSFEVDEPLFDFWPGTLKVDDFEIDLDDHGNLVCLVEKESRSFGIALYGDCLLTMAEALDRVDSADGDFTPSVVNTPLKANDRWTLYTILVAPLDRLLTEEERARHIVAGHQRRLASGRVVPVRSHDRSNPRRLQSRRTNKDEIAHLVYRVRDADGVIRYIGEGLRKRPEHVNSGASHNVRINEHFFLRGPMTVEIVREHLSKDEALAVERLLIKSHKPGVLWNVKDYEPFGRIQEA